MSSMPRLLELFRRAIREKFLGNRPLMWLLGQNVFVRLLALGKLLVVASLLGPANMGLYVLMTMMLTTAELLSDTGLPTAIIQDPANPDAAKLGAAWSVLMARGVVLGALLGAFAPVVSGFFREQESSWVLAAAGVITMFKGALHPRYFCLQRDRRFELLAPIEITVALVDAIVCIVMIHAHFGIASMIVGAWAAEFVRVLGSWVIRSPVRMVINLDLRLIRGYLQYGRWLWGSSCMTLVLNNIDKFVVGRILGTQELGRYQTSVRISQMAVSDVYTMLSVYLLPTLAEKWRVDKENAREYMIRVLCFSLTLAVGVAAILASSADLLLGRFLGANWAAAEPILQLSCVTTILGAGIAILVSYHKATGRSRNVAIATAVQLVMAVPLVIGFGYRWGGVGVVAANCLGLLAALSYMLYTAFHGEA